MTPCLPSSNKNIKTLAYLDNTLISVQSIIKVNSTIYSFILNSLENCLMVQHFLAKPTQTPTEVCYFDYHYLHFDEFFKECQHNF